MQEKIDYQKLESGPNPYITFQGKYLINDRFDIIARCFEELVKMANSRNIKVSGKRIKISIVENDET